ncbi:MAG: alpha/beta hydrolase family protein [Sedimentibacter sp.]
MENKDIFQMFPESPIISDEVLRALRTIPYGFGDFAEIYKVCRRIDVKNLDTWYDSWKWMADRCREQGDAAAAEGHFITAGKRYKNAAAYYRNSEFHLSATDERRPPNYEFLTYCFKKGTDYDKEKPEYVKIPYEGSFLYGLFIKAEGTDGKPAPCAAFVGGLDSLKEEFYMILREGYLNRGISILAVDGPGQGATLRLNGIVSRFDYEAAGTPIIDYLETRDDVDSDRIAIGGMSTGGYYAPRIAAYEPRYKACICWSAQYDYGQIWQTRSDDHPLAPFLSWILGTKTVKEAKEKIKDFTLSPEILKRIEVPVLILHGEDDPLIPLDVAKRLKKDLINSPDANLTILDETTGGVLHCGDDSAQIIVDTSGDWLVDVFGLPKK